MVTGFQIAEDLILPAVAPDSQILVLASDSCLYEAFLLEEGTVGLYLPEDVRPLGVGYTPVWGTPYNIAES